jgi:transmembrane sensor
MSDHALLLPKHYQEAAEWLLRLQEDQSTAEIERWIEWCTLDPKNQQAFERLMPLWQLEQAEPAQAISPAVSSAAARPDVPLALPLRARRFTKPVWVPWAAAAGIAAVAVGIAAAVMGRIPSVRGDGEVRLAAVDTLSSQRAQSRSARLSDGSQVALGAQSQIAVRFGGGQRQIEIEHGEAFFTVQHNRAEPFVVGAGGVQVVAVGTAFDVDRRGGRVGVTVQDGTVEVSLKAAGGKPISVTRGSQLVIDETGVEAPVVRVVSPEAADAWRRGRLEYISEPLPSVIEDLNRYSSDRIVLDDPKLRDLRYSGTIDVTLIQEWLHALPSIFAVRLHPTGNHQIALLPAAPAS